MNRNLVIGIGIVVVATALVMLGASSVSILTRGVEWGWLTRWPG